MGPSRQEGLLRRAAQGDERAFVLLVRPHEESLAALIRRLVADEHQREDLLQDTLLSAWRGLGALRDAGKLRPWLYQVARNRCRDHLKSAQRRFVPTDGEDLDARLTRFHVRRETGTDEQAAVLAEALASVRAPERTAAELFYLKGLSIAEIAQRTRRPPGTIKRLLFCARRALGGLLNREGREGEKRTCRR